jgi:hypothetical protein
MSKYEYDYDHWQTCRLCGERASHRRMLRYNTRHYAHFECFAKRKTLADIDHLPESQREAFWRWAERDRRARAEQLEKEKDAVQGDVV